MEFVEKTRIEKGWSGDKKYSASTADGKRYLLRVAPEEKSAACEMTFQMQQKVAALGVPMSQPVEFGKCSEGAYTVQTWIDGKDAEEVIPSLPGTKQYSYGLEAGRILKKIHAVPAPQQGEPDWEARFNAKLDRKRRLYEGCPIKFDGDEAVFAYIEEKRHLLKGRPQCFQHGDYHIGNMMIEEGRIVIIDFDRCDFGDPWEEFNRIVWCVQASPLFASGMVSGYFDGDVPLEFWNLLALYISGNLLSSIPWAIPYGEGEIQTMLRQAKDVLAWYGNMQNTVPAWYCKG